MNKRQRNKLNKLARSLHTETRNNEDGNIQEDLIFESKNLINQIRSMRLELQLMKQQDDIAELKKVSE